MLEIARSDVYIVRVKNEHSVSNEKTKSEIYNKYTDKLLVTVDGLDEVRFTDEAVHSGTTYGIGNMVK